ncbi:transposase family protein [Streptomyces sp. NPDC056333]|uniref:transposase family protein n=1 Tax=Streptomyces sp. NPDC056333 TaxID=3345786 RepID=UPI0035DEDBD3
MGLAGVRGGSTMWTSRRSRLRPARPEVVARGRAARAACPGCGRFSDRVHDRHQRRVKDLPRSGSRATRRHPEVIPADAGSGASPSSSTGAAYRWLSTPGHAEHRAPSGSMHSRRSAFTAAR